MIRACLLLVFTLLAAAPAWAKTQPEGLVLHPTPAPVYHMLSGTIVGTHQTEAYVATPGTVTEVNVTKGQRVKEGDKLGHVSDTLLNLRLQTLTAQRDLFATHAAETEKEAARLKDLYDAGKTTERDATQAAFSAQMAKQGFETAQASHTELADFLKANVLKSPISGQIVQMNLVTGTTVYPGDNLMLIADRPLRARVMLPAGLNPDLLKVGQKVKVSNLLRTTATVQAKVMQIQSDTTVFPGPHIILKANTFENEPIHQQVTVIVPGQMKDGFYISPDYILEKDGKTFVVLKASGEVMVSVTAVRPDGLVEILTGVKDGDEILKPTKE
jgi:RND family efflux transporter MFP subunit